MWIYLLDIIGFACVGEFLISIQGVALLPPKLVYPPQKKCFTGEGLGTTTCLNTVVIRNGMLPVKYFHSNKTSFLYQLNFMGIAVRQSQS